MASPSIPLWQQQELSTLSSGGMLSGVDPLIIAAIDQAESSGGGGYINSSGYGGFFGLGVGSKYPGGTPTSGLLQDTSVQGFDQQAVIAASEFASLLEANNMSPYAAEQAYQGGGTEGTTIFSELGVPGSSGAVTPLVSPGQVGAINAYTTGNTSGNSTNIAKLGPFQLSTPYGFISRALLVIVGIFLLYLGAKQLFGNSNNAIDTVVIGTKQARQTMTRHAKTAATTAGAAAG